jgi:hypothetical protein
MRKLVAVMHLQSTLLYAAFVSLAAQSIACQMVEMSQQAQM